MAQHTATQPQSQYAASPTPYAPTQPPAIAQYPATQPPPPSQHIPTQPPPATQCHTAPPTRAREPEAPLPRMRREYTEQEIIAAQRGPPRPIQFNMMAATPPVPQIEAPRPTPPPVEGGGQMGAGPSTAGTMYPMPLPAYPSLIDFGPMGGGLPPLPPMSPQPRSTTPNPTAGSGPQGPRGAPRPAPTPPVEGASESLLMQVASGLSAIANAVSGGSGGAIHVGQIGQASDPKFPEWDGSKHTIHIWIANASA